jgi:glycosyltransferase involved in cell wall biosynthesis
MKEKLNKNITVFSPFLNPVGVKRATFGLAKVFSQNGYDVNLLSVHKEWKGLKLKENMKITYLHTNFKKMPTEGFLIFRLVSLLIAIRTFFSLASFLRSNRTEILFVSMMPTIAWLALKFSGKSKNIHLVISLQGFPRDNMLRRRIWRKIFNNSKDVVAESEGLMKKVIKMTGVSKNVNYIYNPHFETQNEIKSRSEFVRPDYKYILGLGRLTKQKNFSMLIKAFRMIDNFNDLKLVIIGDGEEKSKLKKIANKMKINSKVLFLGNLEDPLGYLENAEFLVIPSLWEGLPRVAIEAQALKTPIISACEEGGLGEILMNGEAGLIIKNNDVNEMKNSIEKYLHNPKLALGHSELGFNNIARFALETSAKEYLTKFSNYFEENV